MSVKRPHASVIFHIQTWVVGLSVVHALLRIWILRWGIVEYILLQEFPPYFTHTKVLEYLKSYVTHFDLEKYIFCSRTVTRIEPSTIGGKYSPMSLQTVGDISYMHGYTVYNNSYSFAWECTHADLVSIRIYAIILNLLYHTCPNCNIGNIQFHCWWYYNYIVYIYTYFHHITISLVFAKYQCWIKV